MLKKSQERKKALECQILEHKIAVAREEADRAEERVTAALQREKIEPASTPSNTDFLVEESRHEYLNLRELVLDAATRYGDALMLVQVLLERRIRCGRAQSPVQNPPCPFNFDDETTAAVDYILDCSVFSEEFERLCGKESRMSIICSEEDALRVARQELQESRTNLFLLEARCATAKIRFEAMRDF